MSFISFYCRFKFLRCVFSKEVINVSELCQYDSDLWQEKPLKHFTLSHLLGLTRWRGSGSAHPALHFSWGSTSVLAQLGSKTRSHDHRRPKKRDWSVRSATPARREPGPRNREPTTFLIIHTLTKKHNMTIRALMQTPASQIKAHKWPAESLLTVE